jgi:threonine dehydratase
MATDAPADATANTAPLVTIEAIRAAADVLRGVIVRTPLVSFGPPEDRRFLKAESLQPIGAFKIRGAYATIAGLEPVVRARGVITYSSGNHAQGVARAARLLGIPAVIVMPSDAPAIKRDRVLADGAEVIVVGTASDERERVARATAAERGLTVIPPYDDDRIIAGQGTIGLELLEDLPDLAAVLIPIGGGGLASGIATAVKSLRPSVRLIGVEPELGADARDSLARGEIVRWDASLVSRTIADGTRTQAIGQRTFAHLRAYLDDVVTVSEAEIVAAVRLAAERSRLVAEPSGALSVAALAFRRTEAGLDGIDGPVVAVVSGGNVDPDRYREYLSAPIPKEP